MAKNVCFKILILKFLFVGLLGSKALYAIDISGCTVIWDSGTYNLVANIFNTTATTCIDIRASNVTFNGNSYLIDGQNNPRTYGIRVASGLNGPTLTDVNINNIHVNNFELGIYFDNVSSSTIEDCSSNNSHTGIHIFGSDSNTIQNCELKSNDVVGVFLYRSDSNTVTRNIVDEGSLNANCIRLDNSRDNLIYDNLFRCWSLRLILYDEEEPPNDWSIPKTPGTNIVGGPYRCGNAWGSEYCSADLDSDYLCDNAFWNPPNKDPCPLILPDKIFDDGFESY